MHFKGQLLLPDDSGPGLRVNLDVAEHHLAVESDGGGLGAWPLEVVDVERLNGDIFSLTVAGEPLRFVADDTIGFAYSAIPTIERVTTRRPRPRSAFRSMLNRIWNGPEEAASPPPVQSEPEQAPSQQEVPGRDGPIEQEAPSQESMSADVIQIPEFVQDTSDSVIDVDELIEETEEILPLAPTQRAEASPVGEQSSDPATCKGIRSDGRPCESPIVTTSGYCYSHDPKRAFEDKYKAAQEARAQLKRDATARLNRVYGRLDKAMRQVERGELDPETAMAMAQLARTMCAILDIDEPLAEDDHR